MNDRQNHSSSANLRTESPVSLRCAAPFCFCEIGGGGTEANMNDEMHLSLSNHRVNIIISILTQISDG